MSEEIKKLQVLYNSYEKKELNKEKLLLNLSTMRKILFQNPDNPLLGYYNALQIKKINKNENSIKALLYRTTLLKSNS